MSNHDRNEAAHIRIYIHTHTHKTHSPSDDSLSQISVRLVSSQAALSFILPSCSVCNASQREECALKQHVTVPLCIYKRATNDTGTGQCSCPINRAVCINIRSKLERVCNRAGFWFNDCAREVKDRNPCFCIAACVAQFVLGVSPKLGQF